MLDIECLPIETFVVILKQTDGITLGKCRRVCKKWKDCIDGADWLWHELCKKDFKHSSKIAKEKCGIVCDWYHIYKNLKMWSDVTSFDINHITIKTKDMYDMCTLKRIPVSIPGNCLKIANNDYATIILLKYGLFIQKSIDNITNTSEAFYKADNFILSGDTVYFFDNRDVFKCDIAKDNHNISAEFVIRSDYDIKDIQYDNNVLHIFTDCGKIVNVFKDNSVEVKPINCPPEWVKQIQNVQAINDNNFVCFSRNFFKIETDDYQHFYLDFPPITALFFYSDVVLIGNKAYFENIAVLPKGKFAVRLDVCERKCGPVIVAATFFEIFLMEIDFFPNDKEYRESPPNKTFMYKRLLRLRDRIDSHVGKL
ncbi:hypothetical protein ABMA28_010519 [Loxostege sticticalis]|uniref:F-box domain-containing protein n=1 Tax=Loxostege sticticalis TaxID=481309 RepID=A0ABD0S8I7_LOXSC